MRKLLPILLALIGTGAGVGAGLFLMPKDEEHAEVECLPPGDAPDLKTVEEDATEDQEPSDKEYVKLNNQFLVPVISSEAVSALVVLSLSLEVNAGATENVYAREPKLRDDFLQVLFDHANIGGFDGAFTDARRMGTLRSALLDVAKAALGPSVSDVLITEIARQDV